MTAADRSTTWRRRNVLALAIGACALVLPGAAQADGRTRAELLFRDGRALLDARRYDEACPKLAESQRLEPGAGTLLALALCHEGQGKLATASAELKRASELGRRLDRRDLAAAADRRAQVLEASVAHLVVRLPEGESYRVTCDGEPILTAEIAAPLAMDPGEHRVEVAAAGKTSRRYVVRISAGGSVEIVVDRLDDAAAAAAPEASPYRRPVVTILTEPPAEPEKRGGGQRAVGIIVLGAGVVGLGAGAYFGGKALSESRQARRMCPSPVDCRDGEVTAMNDSAKASLRASMISVAAGAGALTVGAIVYFLAPSGSASRAQANTPRRTAHVVPAAGPSGVSLDVVGTF